VLKRTKEILNHIHREDDGMLYEALKVYFKFFASKKDSNNLEDENDENMNNYELSTIELIKMLEFVKLPNDMLTPLIEEIKDDLLKNDKEKTNKFNFTEAWDTLEKYEVIQQFELCEYEKESTFVQQFFLRVLHEIGMVDLRMNNKFADERSFYRDATLQDDQIGDDLIDRNVEVEENPEYWVTDVNEMLFPLPDNYHKVFWKNFTYAEQKVLYFE
jgi:hypothetical protein